MIFHASKMIKNLLNKRASQLQTQKEIAEVKETLEEKQSEFITSNEYGSFSSPEIQEIEKEEKSETPLDLPQNEEEAPLSDQDKKKLETLLLEAQHLKRNGKIEEYEQKLIEGLSIDSEALEVLKPLSELYFTLGNYKKAISLLKKVTEKDP